MRKTPVILILFCCVAAFSEINFYGNRSFVNWKSADTEHFNAHYPVEFREQAEVAVTFAESIYDTIVQRYNCALPNRINLAFENALFSNGEANPIYNMMHIWLTDWNFKVRGTHSWISNVVSHEFAHLVSMQCKAQVPAFIHSVFLSKNNYLNERRQFNLNLSFPFMRQPFWFAEGTAQFESYRMGFDFWDSHRDMIMRVAFLEDMVLPLAFMHNFSEQALEAEQGPYTQGFDLVRYIAETYGEAAIPELWKELRRFNRLTMDGALEQQLKISEKQLYENWKAARLEHYRSVRDSVGSVIAGKKISANSFYQDFLSVVNGDVYGLSNFGDDFFDGGVFSLSDSILDTLSEPNVPKPFGKFKLQKPYLSQGMSVKQTAKGLLLAYVSYKNRDRKGKPYFDIIVTDTLDNSRIVTKFADAVYPDISPDGKQVVFARREANGTRFILSIASADSLADYKDIFVSDGAEFGIFNPKFSPNGERIVFDFFDGTKRKVATVNKDGTGFKVMAAGDFDARDPTWSANGKEIYFSCDVSGIFNLYKIDLETGGTRQVSNVLGGAFSPVADSSGLYYIGYDSDGFSIYKLDSALAGSKAADIPQGAVELPKRQSAERISFSNAERGYSQIPRMPVLVPLLSFDDRPPDFGAVNTGIMVPKGGLILGLSDPLGKNYLQAAFLQELGRFGEDSQYDLFATIENTNTPINLNLQAMRSNTPSKDTVRYEDPNSYGDSTAINEYASIYNNILLSASYSIFKKGDTLSLFTSYDWETFNLYQDIFSWDYHKRIKAGVLASLTLGDSLAGISALYSFSDSRLFRPGTFAESFIVNESGVISPVYKRYNLHEWGGAAFLQLGSPLQKNGKLSLTAFGSGILSWNVKDSLKTLNSFYLHPMVMEGYPILQDSENYFRQGRQVFVAEARYKFPVYNEFRRNFWIFTTNALNFSLFAQAGSAWDSNTWRVLKHRENWSRSLGVEWNFENTLFYYSPFNFKLIVARGLDAPKETHIKFYIGM